MKYDSLSLFDEINTNGLHKDAEVLVWCATYNHVDYIEDALKGFINQTVNFPYVVIIFDDASTDGTSDIIRQYAETYPEKFCIYIAKQNTYGNTQRKEMFHEIIRREFSGKYVALCEGDDFWIDRNKLQIQYDYMEENEKCSFTMHNSIMIDCTTNGLEAFNKYEMDTKLGYFDALTRDVRLATASLMYRFDYEFMPDMFYNNGIGDFPRILYLVTKGYGYYFDRIMAVYRNKAPNSWTAKRSKSLERHFAHLIKMSDFLLNYNIYTKNRYTDEIRFSVYRRVCRFLESIEDTTDINDGGVELICSLYDKYCSNVINKDELIRLAKHRFSEGHCTDEIKKAVNDHSYVVIWGTGDGALRLSEQMKRDGVKYDGYIVGDPDNKTTSYFNKPVYPMDNIPFPKEDTLVIVSLYFQLMPRDLIKILEKNGYSDYLMPYVMEVGI